jgi:4,5-dihydroxyphthalate decarboxylase
MQHPLKIAIGRRADTEAIFDGSVPAPRGLRVEVVDARPFNVTFKRMVRGLEFDVCELGITTHFLARAHGCPIVALPVFPAAYYPHSGIECSRRSGITSPRDLNGARVGVRSFSAPSAVWARGALSRQFGVDTGSITWVVASEEIVPDLRLPANVVSAGGADLRTMLSGGQVDAGIGLSAADENVYPLWADPRPVERDFGFLSGGTPLNHAVVIKEELLAHAEELVSWFAAAAGAPQRMTEANRLSLAMLLDLTREQLPDEKALPTRFDDAFAVVTSRPVEETI